VDDVHKKLLKLNLGCGLNASSEWVNIDGSFSALLSKRRVLYHVLCKIFRIKPVPWPKNIKIIDVRKGLPFPDGAAEAIFSSHMLEHLDFDEGDFVIKESFRCLRREGVIRIIVPDLYQIAKRYVDGMINDPKEEQSYNFLRDLNTSAESYKGIWKIIYNKFGHSKHLSMYDERSLKKLLEKHGFAKIQRMEYSQSRISDIKLVEEKGRHEMAICIEGLKE